MPEFEERLTQEKCTDEQRSAITNPNEAWMLQACPGSGKTKTAALRVGYWLQQWPHKHRGIALLSHTNVAIESFFDAFGRLGLSYAMSYPHFVGTLDSFITKYILHPFGHIVMECSRSPILIEGDEHFLTRTSTNSAGKTSSFAAYGVNPALKGEPWPCVTKFEFILDGNEFIGIPTQEHKTRIKNTVAEACKQRSLASLVSFGKRGFYTHSHAKYWTFKLLAEHPKIAQILAQRFPRIIVDEAQDTGSLQEAILKVLSEAGIALSLVGDPDQAIYAFSGADGKVLERFSGGQKPLNLSTNFRSNRNIVQAIKSFSGMQDMLSSEGTVEEGYGAFVTVYPNEGESNIISAFSDTITSLSLNANKSAVLFRAKDDCRSLLGENIQGSKSGLIPHFVKAACYRETGDIDNAYKELSVGIFNLMLPDYRA